MANYSSLKTAIQNVIKTNGTQAITGAVLQDALLSIINSVGANSQFADIATPTTNPGTPDQNVFYLASEPGTYSNFGGIQIADGEVVILEWHGSWAKKITGFATESKLTELESKTANILFYPNGTLFGDITIISEYDADIILKSDGTTQSFSGYNLYTIKNDNTANRYLYIEAMLNTASLSFASIGLYRKSDNKFIGAYQYNGKIVLGIHPNYYVKFNSKSEVKTSYTKKDIKETLEAEISVNKERIVGNFICGDMILSGEISEINGGYVNGILKSTGDIQEDFLNYKVYTIRNESEKNKILYVEAPIDGNITSNFASVCIYKEGTDEFLIAYRTSKPDIVKLPVGYYGKFSFTSDSHIRTSYSITSSKTFVEENLKNKDIEFETENPMAFRPTNTLIGTNEEEDGYYEYSTGAFKPTASYKSRKYTVKGNTNYAITARVSGNPTCLAIAVGADNKVLTYYNKGANGITDVYTDYIITTPSNTAYLLCSSAEGVYPIVKDTILDLISKHYVDKNLESCSEFIVINGTNEEEDGYYEYSTGAFKPVVNYKSTKYRAKGNTNYAITALVNGGPTCLAVAVDRDNKVLTYYNKGTNGVDDNYTDYIISTPKNTAYLLCTGAKGNYPIVKQVSYNPVSKQYVKEEIEKTNLGDELLSYWKGKKGVWLGTSIPAQGYPINCGRILGMNMANESKGSSMARAGRKAHTPDNPLGDVYGVTGVAWQNICYSLTLGQEEKHDIFLNWTTEQRKANLKLKGYGDEDLVDIKGFSELMAGNFYGEETDESQVTSPSSKPTDIMADNYIPFRKICYSDSWNNSLNIEDGFGEIKGRVEKYLSWDNTPNLWVLDHGHNDNLSSDSDEEFVAMPVDTYDRWTFLGAMNFLIKKIFDFNPRARIVIIGHYNNSDNKYKRIGEAQKVLADYWNIPIYEAWKYLQMPRNRVITTNAYWDKNRIWHNSGFDGTNGYDGSRFDGVNENIRQLEDGTWVHDISLLHAWMVDGLHPGSSDAKEYEARNMASFIRNNVL